MSTREENLKKINAELEKLDDEQLEKIAGGSWIDDFEISKNPINPNPAKDGWMK